MKINSLSCGESNSYSVFKEFYLISGPTTKNQKWVDSSDLLFSSTLINQFYKQAFSSRRVKCRKRCVIFNKRLCGGRGRDDRWSKSEQSARKRHQIRKSSTISFTFLIKFVTKQLHLPAFCDTNPPVRIKEHKMFVLGCSSHLGSAHTTSNTIFWWN